jgi:hypothetical protein
MRRPAKVREYTNESFKGTYGFSIVYGANVALGLGIAISTGDGNFRAVQLTNVGGTVTRSEIVGTYSLNPDGTGSATITARNPDGSTQQGNFYYVVLSAEEYRWGFLATELQGMAVQPGPGGGLGLSYFKLIPGA